MPARSRPAPRGRRRRAAPRFPKLPKCPTGIRGFDEITGGGLPRGRVSIVCGGPGTGKTLFAMEFLARGALERGEAGVMMSFEETGKDLARNVASLGFDVKDLVRRKLLVVDHVALDRGEALASGEFDLDGLFIRLDHAIRSVGAKRVVLDTVESLFTGLPNAFVVRAELRRLFQWLKRRGVTTLLTAEPGEKTLTREGLEEYVSDCVIALDQRVRNEVATRRLRVLKYRGSAHGTNEFPLILDERGFSIVPITGSELAHAASREKISLGVRDVDRLLAGQGVYRGSSILVSGGAGTGKSTLAAAFVDAACRRGERALYVSFEESPGVLVRDLRSVGLDLQRWVDRGLLHFDSARATSAGLETHAARIQRKLRETGATIVVVDPVSVFDALVEPREAKNLLVLLSDVLRAEGATAMMTYLVRGDESPEATDAGFSSIADVWILLRNLESDGERNRAISVLKARGIAHSNQIREFVLDGEGVHLAAPYVGPEGLLVGSARASLEAKEEEAAEVAREEVAEKREELRARRRKFASDVDTLKDELAASAKRIGSDIRKAERRIAQRESDRSAMSARRAAGSANGRGDRA